MADFLICYLKQKMLIGKLLLQILKTEKKYTKIKCKFSLLIRFTFGTISVGNQ